MLTSALEGNGPSASSLAAQDAFFAKEPGSPDSAVRALASSGMFRETRRQGETQTQEGPHSYLVCSYIFF